MYVIASDFQQAYEFWSNVVAVENDCFVDDIEMPTGIQFVSHGDDLISKEDSDKAQEEIKSRK